MRPAIPESLGAVVEPAGKITGTPDATTIPAKARRPRQRTTATMTISNIADNDQRPSSFVVVKP